MKKTVKVTTKKIIKTEITLERYDLMELLKLHKSRGPEISFDGECKISLCNEDGTIVISFTEYKDECR